MPWYDVWERRRIYLSEADVGGGGAPGEPTHPIVIPPGQPPVIWPQPPGAGPPGIWPQPPTGQPPVIWPQPPGAGPPGIWPQPPTGQPPVIWPQPPTGGPPGIWPPPQPTHPWLPPTGQPPVIWPPPQPTHPWLPPTGTWPPPQPTHPWLPPTGQPPPGIWPSPPPAGQPSGPPVYQPLPEGYTPVGTLPAGPPDMESPGYWGFVVRDGRHEACFIQSALITDDTHEPIPPAQGLPGEWIAVYGTDVPDTAFAWIPTVEAGEPPPAIPQVR